MSIKIKETKLSQLLTPPDKHVLLLIDSEDGNQLKVKGSDGIVYTIPRTIGGGGATGDSVVIGSTKSGAPVGAYYLANGFDVSPQGDYSQSSGRETTASGDYSHASGIFTIASGSYSFSGGVGQVLYSVKASGSGSFNFSKANSRSSEAGGNNSVILGGVDNVTSIDNSVIIGGSNNTIGAGATSSVIIGCNSITANTPSSVYVPNIILKNWTFDTDEEGSIMYNGTGFVGRVNEGNVSFITTDYASIPNWNSAFNWGDHHLMNYLTIASASSTYLAKAGGTMTGWLSGTSMYMSNHGTFNNSISIGTTSTAAPLYILKDAPFIRIEEGIANNYWNIATSESYGDFSITNGAYINAFKINNATGNVEIGNKLLVNGLSAIDATSGHVTGVHYDTVTKELVYVNKTYLNVTPASNVTLNCLDGLNRIIILEYPFDGHMTFNMSTLRSGLEGSIMIRATTSTQGYLSTGTFYTYNGVSCTVKKTTGASSILNGASINGWKILTWKCVVLDISPYTGYILFDGGNYS